MNTAKQTKTERKQQIVNFVGDYVDQLTVNTILRNSSATM